MTEPHAVYARTAAAATVARDYEPLFSPSRLSWQGIFAGIVTAVAVQIVLGLIGIAVGLGMVNAVNPDGGPSANAVGLGAALWTAFSLLAALYYGGFIAARVSRHAVLTDGVVQGIVVWASTMLLTASLLFSAFGALLGGVSMGPLTASLSTQGPASDDSYQAKVRDLITSAPNGASPTTPEQEEAQGDVIAQSELLLAGGDDAADANGRITTDLQTLGMPADQAKAKVADLDKRVDYAKQKARQAADKAAHAAAKTAGISALVLILGMVAAAFGGRLGTAHAAASLIRYRTTDIEA